MNRISLIPFLLCTTPLSSHAQKIQQPHIVLILCDDMGFSDLGCYGSEIHTPNIDKLARNGMSLPQEDMMLPMAVILCKEDSTGITVVCTEEEVIINLTLYTMCYESSDLKNKRAWDLFLTIWNCLSSIKNSTENVRHGMN